MGSFNDVFGGGTIYPSDPTYLALTMSTDQTLQWPIEQQIGGNVAAAIVDVNSTGPGLNINLSDARQVSTGYTSLFNNVGANTVSIRNSTGGTLLSLTSGTVWEIYLTDNTTAAGTWRVFQFGASVSTAVAAALAGAGLKAIGPTLNEKISISSHNANYALIDSDRATMAMWIGGAGTFTLPDPSTVGADWFASIRNSGSGDLTVTPAAGLIDATASKTFPSTSSAFVVTDGTNYYTLGFGLSATGGTFGYDPLNIAGSGDFTLAGADLNRIAYNLTGLLTGNRNLIVPTAVQQYWITNNTTGAFTVTVKTALGTGIIVTQGTAAILYCDGTNVVIAQSTGTTFPITIGEGGTGATTAAGARTNLGATATGNAVFTAVSAAAGLSALGGVPTTRSVSAGTGLTGGGDLSADRTITLGIPVLVVNGGTGAITAAAARTNLAVPGLADNNTFSGNNSFQHQVSVTQNDTSACYFAANSGSGGNYAIGSFMQDRYSKLKVNDDTRTSTTTLTDDSELVITSVPVGNYIVRSTIMFGAAISSGMGIKYTLNFTGTSSANGFRGLGDVFTSLYYSGDIAFGAPAGIGTISSGTVPDKIDIVGRIIVTGTGTLSLQYAQNSSTGNALTMSKGSLLELIRVT